MKNAACVRYTNYMIKAIFCLVMALVLASCAGKPRLDISRPGAAWETDFEHSIGFHALIDESLLVVGTARHLFGIDPQSGERIWRLRNVSASNRDVVGVDNAPIILVNDASGGKFDDAGTYVLALDRNTGEILWESPVLDGRVLQGRLDKSTNRLIVVTVTKAHGDDRGLLSDLLPNKGLRSGFKREPYLTAIDMEDGTRLWSRRYGTQVLMRPSRRLSLRDEVRVDARPFDLGLYHAPVISGYQVCGSYDGIHCFNVKSGQPLWKKEFRVIDDKLALSYPAPIVTDDLLVAGGAERVHAFDPVSGKMLWRSRKLGRMPDIQQDEGGRIYIQLGGRYFDLDKEKWVAKGRFGAAALDQNSGKTLWHYKGVNDSITNLLVVGKHVWFADDKQLFAIERDTGKLIVKASHKMTDSPTYTALNAQRQIVLVSESEVAAYDPSTAKLDWYAHYPAPGPGAWRRFSAGLLRASGSVLKLTSTLLNYGLVPSLPSLSLPIGDSAVKLVSGKSVLEDVTGSIGRSLTAQAGANGEEKGYASLKGGTQYFVTKLKHVKEPVLAAVNLDSGETEQLTALPSEAPYLVIDEGNGYAYQVDHTSLVAIPIGEKIAEAENP